MIQIGSNLADNPIQKFIPTQVTSEITAFSHATTLLVILNFLFIEFNLINILGTYS